MNRDWEAAFSSWGAAPGVTEQTKMPKHERAVKKAIDASTKLSAKSIKVWLGPIELGTNVRQDSDVDICVLYTGSDSFFPDYGLSQGLTMRLWDSAMEATHTVISKTDVESALKSYFGSGSVTRGKKAFNVHAEYLSDRRRTLWRVLSIGGVLGLSQTTTMSLAADCARTMAGSLSTGPSRTIRMALARMTLRAVVLKPSRES